MKTTTTTVFRADAGNVIRHPDVARALVCTLGIGAARHSVRPDAMPFPFDLDLAADHVMWGWSIDGRISTANGRRFDLSTRMTAETFTITLHEV